jgi:tetratricopeptide (TPR) repeat protein
VLRRPRDQAMALNHLQVTLSLMGRFAEGHEAGLREQAIVRQHGLSGTRNIYLDMNLSISALLLGRYREAVEALQRARKAGVLDEATWHLRQAALQLQLGQPARCLAELRPLLEGRVQGPRTVLFNAVMVRLRWLEAHVAQGADATTDARAHRADIEHGLAQAEALAAQTGRAEHRVRLQLMRGRLGPAEAAVPLLRQALDEARANHLRALEAALHAALARALQALQRPEDARAHIDSALALRDAGHVVDQMPGVELDAWAVELLADADPPRAAALLAAALAWVDRTAATEVDEAQRHGFLHAHPAHRRLRALAHDLRLAPHLPAAADAAAAAAPGALSSARAGLAGQSGP